MSNPGFLTLDNIVECETIFQSYMRNTHSVDVSTDSRVRKTLFRIMTDISEAAPSVGLSRKEINAMDIRQLNNLTLNIARDVYMAQSPSPSQIKPTKPPQNQHNPQQMYPSQQSQQNMNNMNSMNNMNNQIAPRPFVSTNRGDQQSMERLISDRVDYGPNASNTFNGSNGPNGSNASNASNGPSRVNEGTKDAPISSEDFEQRMSLFETLRSDDYPERQMSGRQVNQTNQVSQGNQEVRPMSVQSMQSMKLESFIEKTPQQEPRESRESLIQKPPVLSATLVRYLTMAGFDRDFANDKSRYAYTVRINGSGSSHAGCIQSSFKNVLSLSATCVIIPMDYGSVATTCTGTTIGTAAKHECTFSYPYIILNIDNINVVEGTNDATRGAFAVLRFDKFYRAKNGRGYVILVPMQSEAKVYERPLASLNDMHISLTKPNATLLSNARDDYRIERVEYEAFNRMYLKVHTNKFFEASEFLQGDSLYFRGCSYNGLDPRTNDALLTYLNRVQGHDVVELG